MLHMRIDHLLLYLIYVHLDVLKDKEEYQIDYA